MPFRILSIDGGGLRGVIPLAILEDLLRLTGRTSVADSFDLIAGTSTGGIIACALSLKEGGRNKFTVPEILEIYTNHSREIFPDHPFRFSSFFGPKYSPLGLESVLERFFGNAVLQDCKTPVFISAFDVNSYKSFYYSSRLVNPTSDDSLRYHQFKLRDICRSTSAAPTYFSSHHFSYLNNDSNVQMHTLVDGGVFVNNPALAALAEVLSHHNDPLYTKGQQAIKMEDIYILSLGTGIGARNITKKQAMSWGQVKWARPLIEIMMQGNSLSVDHQLRTLMDPAKYCRLDVRIPQGATDMDDNSKRAYDIWMEEVNRGIINNQRTRDELAAFVNNAGL